MLISTKAVIGCSLENSEGSVGTVHDLFFNDESWVVRYMVVSTGGWLSNRRVLLPPTVVKQRDWSNQRLAVSLTQQQIKDSPEVDTDKPVSRQMEEQLDQYAAWAPMGGVGAPVAAAAAVRARPREAAEPGQSDSEKEGDSRLRSVTEIAGYHIEATDGEIGHIEELIMNDEGELHGLWEFPYIVVDTRDWLPGRKVLVTPFWAEWISWEDRKVRVDLAREQIMNSPEYDPRAPINRQFEEMLFDYYGKPKYWIPHRSSRLAGNNAASV